MFEKGQWQMKLIIDIPKEFETDYQGDKFKDFFSRVLCDIKGGTLCGNYEKETAEMFLKAFDESKPMTNIVEKLEELKKPPFIDTPYHTGFVCGVNYSINIVKQEINNGLE